MSQARIFDLSRSPTQLKVRQITSGTAVYNEPSSIKRSSERPPILNPKAIPDGNEQGLKGKSCSHLSTPVGRLFAEESMG
jgi:hypothetical protein